VSFGMKTVIRAILCLPLFLLLGGCGQNPRIDISPGIENGRVVFNLATSGMNGLVSFAVMEGTNTLWEVSTSYEKGTRIVYGVLPTGGNMAAKQVFPPRSVAPAYIAGKRVTVRVGYQYDHDFSACSGSFEKSMQIPNAEPSGLSQ
jgi:hypothetical protein